MQTTQNIIYRIHELFYSLEGEGSRVGEPTIFVRLAGCNLQCPWCDTADHPQVNFRLTPSQLVDHIRGEGWPAHWICLTGGEPMMQDAPSLCRELQAAGFQVHLETNGTYPIPPDVFNHVTISPKMQAEVPHDRFPFLPENEAAADEFKYVISRPEDLEWVRWGRRIYLQPNCHVPSARQLCVEAVLRNPDWRLSMQIHKILDLP